MNSEPLGTDPDIPDGESAIDVFILCSDDRNSQELSGQLEPQGYRVTLFSDSADLLATLRAGKPNLLICDATGTGQEGYELCREIKADGDLWRIPVLLVTGVASLGDLLGVLDSNADNFIARPYDPQYLLSLIETMLSSPVEKPDPEKVRTQFKIRHEDRDYVIMADRRKLLEFLLSSFEIAIDRADELVQVQNALDSLTSTLERRVTDRTSELSTETARLQMLVNGKARELENAAKALEGQRTEGETLRSRIDEREKVIATHREENTRLTQEIESTRARLAEAEDTVRTLGIEKDELEHALRGDAESLNRDLGQTRKELEEAKKELADLAGHRDTLTTQIAELTRTHEEAQKALNAYSVEIGQLKSALGGEKNRADSAETEVKSIMQEKARSEQDLRQMVEDITGKATQQSQECLRLTDALAIEKERRVAAEEQCGMLAQEAAKKEAAFAAEKGSLVEHHEAFQQKYDALTESFGAERQKCSSLEAELVRITGSKEQAERGLQAVQEELRAAVAAGEEERRMRAAAEAGAAETGAAKDGELQALKNDIAALRDELETARSDLVQARQELDAALGTHKGLKEELAAAALAGAQADKLARSAVSEIEQVREELATERHLHHAAEEKISEITRAKEQIEHQLSAAGEQAAAQERELLAKIQGLTEALDAERDARSHAEDALARVAAEKETAHQKLQEAAEERTAARATGEQAAARERELLAKIQGLTDTLDAERDARSQANDELASVTREREVADQRLKAAVEEKVAEVAHRNERIAALEADLRAALDRQQVLEKQLHAAGREQSDKQTAEQRLQAAAVERSADNARRNEQIAAFEADLQTALDRQRSLEEQLRTAEHEQAEKEAAMQALSREIERATAALDAEKEERHAAEEAYAEAKDTLVALRKKPQIPSTAIEEVPIGKHAMVALPPDLPATIREGPHALARKEIDRIVPVQQAPADPKSTDMEIPHVTIRSVEDLFEDPREIDVDELPDAIRGMQPPAVEVDQTGAEEGNLPEPGDDGPDEADEEETGHDDGDEVAGEDESGNSPDAAADETSGIPVFSRQQWLDLVKWAHNAGTLSHEERIRIVKLGRLIQKGRVLTRRQEAQLAELMLLAHAKGYRPRE